MKTVTVNSVVWREGNHFVSQCLDVDVSSFGATKMDALNNLKEALELYWEDMPMPTRERIENPEIVPLTVSHG